MAAYEQRCCCLDYDLHRCYACIFHQVEDVEESDEEDEDMMDDDGAATPALGTSTPFGVDTPMVSMGSDGIHFGISFSSLGNNSAVFYLRPHSDNLA